MKGEWIAGKAREVFGQVFGGGWDDVGNDILQGRCPGEASHSHASAATDCRIFLSYGPKGEKPGAYCLHNSCRGHLDDLNRKFRDLIFTRDEQRSPAARKDQGKGVARKPLPPREAWIPPFDRERLERFVAPVGTVTPEWFEARSPLDPRGMTPGRFLESIYDPGDRVLVFTEFKSQGDFLWEVGRGGFRLADRRGVKAVPSKLPTDGGKDGVWFLNQPVDGRWHINPRREGRWSRRSEEAVQKWKYLVLESDEADERQWLAFLAMCPFHVRAIYSSGGKSWHALITISAGKDEPVTKAWLDGMLREKAKRLLPMFGADPAAMTPVRLTRLPGCTRNGRLQRLIWLDPKGDGSQRIRDHVPVRKIS